MRRAIPLLLIVFLLVSLPPVPARGATVTEIQLAAVDATNGSLAEAFAELRFAGNASELLPVDFAWYAPTGIMVWQETASPDSDGVARSTFVVTAEGDWLVNASYPGPPQLSGNLSLRVLPSSWGPGTFDVPRHTQVGRFGTLAIVPGTTVRFGPGAALNVEGALDARGTATLPIDLTSSSPSPGPWSWGGVYVEGEGTAALENATVRFASQGIWVRSPGVRIHYVTVERSSVGLLLDAPELDARSLRFQWDDVGIGTSGFGGRIEDVTILGTPLGMTLADSLGARFEGVSILDSSDAGVSSAGGDVYLRNATISNSTTGVLADGGTVRLEDVSILRGSESLVVRRGRIEAWNATLVDPAGPHGNASLGGSIAFVNATLAQTERIRVDATSSVAFRNFLRVRVEDADRNANVSGATVRVSDDDRETLVLVTDPNGTTPRLVVTDRVFAPALHDNGTRVVAASGALLFSRNDRTVDMGRSRTEVFRGSLFDADGDSEPDFADADDDNDGLGDTVEGTLGTDPFAPDTDGDGMPDGWEFGYQLLPRDPSDAGEDPDSDSLTNLEEYGEGTDPRSRDSDSDGMPDGWEARFGLLPGNASDADRDSDGDGFRNLDEYRGGTDPTDPASHPPTGFEPLWGLAWYALAVALATGIVVLSVRLRRGRKRVPPEGGA